ncbi:Zinc finger protein 804B [Manis javanica]|nr:Zinc finger protein 804B [Manis javanica]
MLALVDAQGSFTIDQVAALPDTAFTLLDTPLNKGYTRDVYWLKLVFPLYSGQPFILRVQTSSPMQLDATLWRSSGLMTQFSAVEGAPGIHQGINLMLALLIIGAALALRLRNLAAMAVAAIAVLIHGASARGGYSGSGCPTTSRTGAFVRQPGKKP